MRTIETPLAMTALRKMAEYLPDRLLRMYKEEPMELIREIEVRVTNAVGWSETAISKGASKDKMQEIMNLLLKPDHAPGNPLPSQISEQKIQEIHQHLIMLAK